MKELKNHEKYAFIALGIVLVMITIVVYTYPKLQALGESPEDTRSTKQKLADEWVFMSEREQTQKDKVDFIQKEMRLQTDILETYQQASNSAFMQVLKANEHYATTTDIYELSCLQIIWGDGVGLVSNICEANNIMDEEQHIILEEWLQENSYTWGDVIEDEGGQYVISEDEGGSQKKIYLKVIAEEQQMIEKDALDN